MSKTAERIRNGRVSSSKKRRIDKEAFRTEIERKYKNVKRASLVLGRHKDFLGKIFRKYDIEFPEVYLREVREKLGVDYEQFLKKNAPRYQDDQITFEQFMKTSEEEDEKETIEFFEEVEKRKAGRPIEHKEEYVRLCTQIPVSTREKMNQAAFELSAPGHIVSMSELLVIWANEYAKRRENA